MNSFPFEFKTTAGGKGAQSFHFHEHGFNTESDARDALVNQLKDLLVQAEALTPSTTPPGGATASPETATEATAPTASTAEATADAVASGAEATAEESAETPAEEAAEGDSATTTPAAPAKPVKKAPAKKGSK